MTSTPSPSAEPARREPVELGRDECLAFLRSVRVGRVILHGSEPGPAAVLPVNFVLEGDQVVLRTGDGVILAAARRGAHVTFQADAIEQTEGGRGWSVTVSGPAQEATGTVLHWLNQLPLAPLAGGSREHHVLIPIQTAEGRWVGVPRSDPADR